MTIDTTPPLSTSELDSFCAGSLPPSAIMGIECFNRGEFFAAHEHLEDAWRKDQSSCRELYRGILQVAVAYHHIQRGNYRGARKMFQRCRLWLRPFPDICRGINLARLRQDIDRVDDELDKMAGISFPIDPSFFQPLDY